MSYTVVEWERGAPSIGAAVAALGVFDGVHLGHRALVSTAIELAAKEGVASAAVTFDRDPDQVVTPDSAAPQLLTLEEKTTYLGECGVDHVIVLPFCMKMSKLPPEMFIRDILAGALEPRVVVVGADFRFGNQASGDVLALSKIGAQDGFEVVAHKLVEVNSEPVTSTRIRALVTEGDVAGAAALLGRPHRLSGRVTKGRGEGTELVVPTANIVPARYAAVPRDGVYAGFTAVEDVCVPSAISVGSPPTFDSARHSVETHLLDFEGDLYRQELTIGFTDRLRDLEAFDDTDALKTQVSIDIARVRQLGT